MKSKLFSIKTGTKATAICALVAILVITWAVPISAHTQLDPGIHDIFQLNELGIMEKRGEIFPQVESPERSATSNTGCYSKTTFTPAQRIGW